MKGRGSGRDEVGGNARQGTLESAGSVGKRTLVETAFAAPSPTAPGKRTLTEGVTIQRRAERDAAADAGAPPPAGGGTPLPANLRTLMESLLGTDFAGVRVHETPYAPTIGARAFTRGDDLYFAPGAYAPESPHGRELIGHELTHVVQQRQGRVPVTSQVGGAPANDDPGLEQEADQMGARAALAARPAGPRMTPVAASQHAQPVQMKLEADADHGTEPVGPYVDELAELEAGTSPDVASGPPIQRKPGPRKRQYISFKIIVSRDMTGEELKATANLQVFGVAQVRAEWKHVKSAYTAADSPVQISVEVSLLRRVRGALNAQSGIDTDETGKVAGADARAGDFLAQPGSDEKSALLAEIDRRYHARSGTAPGAKIKPGEAGNRELWNSIRDEVLFQHQYIANLPDRVKAALHVSIKGRTLTPADYDQLFRIAKKLEALPPGMAADYASKLVGTTSDLATLEATVDSYRAELAGREKEDSERATVQNKLLGLEAVYKLYKRYLTEQILETNPQLAAAKQTAKAAGAKVDTAGDLEHQLEQQLPRYGFASIAEFASYIARFLRSFEEGAVRITLDILQRYAGKLYKEQQRYQDPAVIKDLHGKLGGFRAQHREFATNARIWNDYARQANADHERGRIPGQGHIHMKPPTAEQATAGEKAKAAQANAEAQIKSLSSEYPIFAEDELPTDKRLDKVKLAQADESTLGSVILAHIAERQKVVVEARDQLQGKHELIYKMDKLLPTFYAAMDIQPSSIHDEIIKDKMREDTISKIVGGVLLAIVAVALTVVSLGTATPAMIAAGASIGAAGLSTYMAYEEYKEYTSQHAIAEAGFAEHPSTIWLVLAIAGAGVDMAATAKAVRALAPAAEALEASGDLAKFQKAVQELEKAKQLEQKAAEAAEKAAAARAAYKAAKGELGQALGKAYSFPGPLSDPAVYRSLVKMAVARLRQGGHSLSAFVAELRQARIDAKLVAELSPEELAKVKQAWEEAEKLNAELARLRGIVTDDALLQKLFDAIGDGSRLEQMLKEIGDAVKLEALIAEVGGSPVIRLFTEMQSTTLHNTKLGDAIAKLGKDRFVALVKTNGVDAMVKYGPEALDRVGHVNLDKVNKITSSKISPTSLQKKWKHAPALGITESWKAKDVVAHQKFADAVNDIVSKPAKVFVGPYHDEAFAAHFFQGDKLVITTLDGDFISAWDKIASKLSGIEAAAPPLGVKNFRVK